MPVIEPPTPTLPVVVKEVAVIAPVESEVEVIAPAFNVPKLVNPVTFNPLNAPKPVIEPPTPTLPVVVKEVVVNPPLNTPSPVTVNDPPTPTLPVVVKEVALMFVALMVVEVNAPVLTTPS